MTRLFKSLFKSWSLGVKKRENGIPKEYPCWLADEPSAEDKFGGHTDLANALGELVAKQRGGVAIGLEGKWGSGKSTVISLLRDNLYALKKSKNYLVATFDAWTHEGDPLRHAILSFLIEAFAERGWVKRDKWENDLAALRQKQDKSNSLLRPQGRVLLALIALPLLAAPWAMRMIAAEGSHHLSQYSTVSWIAFGILILPFLIGLGWFIVALFRFRRLGEALKDFSANIWSRSLPILQVVFGILCHFFYATQKEVTYGNSEI